MNFFLILMVILSLIFMFSSHPVSLLVIILLQTMIICITMFIILKTSWYSYILFLIFLGGLMVLFVYVVSLASNEKFEPNLENMAVIFSTSLLMLLTLHVTNFFEQHTFLQSNKVISSVMIIFSDSLVFMTMMLMFYLLFTLIVAVKVSSKMEGPLRNMIK